MAEATTFKTASVTNQQLTDALLEFVELVDPKGTLSLYCFGGGETFLL